MPDDVIGLVLSEVLGGAVTPPVPPAVAAVEDAIHRRPWLTRSSVLVGGAASLAVGALLGGILEGVPVLLPPPVAAASGAGVPVIKGNLAAAAQTVAHSLPALVSHLGPVAPPGGGAPADPVAPVVRAAGSGLGGGGLVPSLPVPTVLGGSGGGAPAPNLPVPPVASTPQGTTQGGGGNGGATSTCSLCGALAPVTSTLQQAAGNLPVAGGTVSGALGSTLQTVSGVLGSATGGSAGTANPLGGAVAPVTSALGSVGSTVSSVPVVGGTVSGAVDTLSGALGGL